MTGEPVPITWDTVRLRAKQEHGRPWAGLGNGTGVIPISCDATIKEYNVKPYIVTPA